MPIHLGTQCALAHVAVATCAQVNPVDADIRSSVYYASVGMGNSSAWDAMRQHYVAVGLSLPLVSHTPCQLWTQLQTDAFLHPCTEGVCRLKLLLAMQAVDAACSGISDQCKLGSCN